jgi:hypothetical protein
MPEPVATPTEGTTIAYAAAEAGPFTLLGGVESVTPPAPKATAVKTTLLTDTVQKYRAGRQPEAGEAKFRVQFDPSFSQHVELRRLPLQPAENKRFWRITYADDFTTHATDTFQAIVTEVSPNDSEEENNQTIELTLQITGDINSTAGSNA